ncbi:MAG: DMT family transporter [Rhodobacteraceae bacterium]|nr:DMT family transporter [Paracoccaceae bacterium]
MSLAAAAARPDRTLAGVGLMIAFCLTAPLLDASAKLAAQTLPTGQITAARFVGQALLMLPVVLALRLPFAMDARGLGLSLLRALLLILSTYSFVAAIAVMPIADALAIVFVEPFVLLLLGWLLFGERVGPRRIGACALGFAGALLVIRPSFAAFGPVALWPLACALFFALYMLLTRGLSRHMHPVAMQFHTAWLGAALLLPVLWLAPLPAFTPSAPDAAGWLWLAGVGLWATVSHMAITWALRFAPAATLAPLHYLELVAAVAVGYLVFGDFPQAWTWAGIALIAGAGLYMIHRERVLARAAALSLEQMPR